MIDENSSIHDRFNHLLQIISSQRFLKKQGLGNEVPFFICPYKPEDDADVKRMLRHLTTQLDQCGLRILTVDLYDLSIEILKKRGYWEQVLQSEASISKDQLKEFLQGVLDAQNHLIPAIVEKMEKNPFDVLFITGVGEVFPYIRSHNVLNNLQSKAKEKPTVLFFPGTYAHTPEGGMSLELFGRLLDDNYYRAFNIYHYEI